MPSRYVRRSGEEYAHALEALLPTGPAWPRDPKSALMQLVSGLGEIWGDVDGRAHDLLQVETDPRQTLELLSDWERAFGLPEVCGTGGEPAAPSRFRVGASHVGRDRLLGIDRRTITKLRTVSPPSTIHERRDALLAKMASVGGQSRPFFIGVAVALGYRVTITEFSPWMLGVSRVGTGAGVQRIGSPLNRFVWRVNVSGFRASFFRAGQSRLGIDRLLKVSPRPDRFVMGIGRVGVDPLLRVGRAEDLECLFRRWKPAQSLVTFNYGQVQ